MKEKSRGQYSMVGRFFKKILHTKIGAWIGYHLGLSGFNRIECKVIENGTVKKIGYSYNFRVNVGAALCAYLQSGNNLGSLTSPHYPIYLALSTSVLSAAYTDTTLTGETSATGMTRASGTIGGYIAPSVLDGAASYTITYTWTNGSGGTVNINSAAIFDAVSAGNMYVEGNTAQTYPVSNTNQFQLTWTIYI